MLPASLTTAQTASAGDGRRDRSWSRPREAVAMFVRGATVRRFGLQLVPLALLVLPLTLGVRPTTVTSEPGPDHSQP